MGGLRGISAWARLGVLGLVAAAAAVPASAQPDSYQMIAPLTATWSRGAARDLIEAVKASRTEGLRPADYGLAALQAALAGGEGAELDAAANAAAMALARDYAFGRVSDRSALGWYIETDYNRLVTLTPKLREAIAAGTPGAFLRGLLPGDPRYVALKTALASASDEAERDRLRANLERWRWMPRSLGEEYLYVNVPSYRLQVVQGGAAVSSYPVVVGAKATQTPMLATPATSLVINPWWNVPPSIVKSAGLRPRRAGGYMFKAGADGGWSVRQPPGPRNALGRIKFNLANDQAIYLHDTPAKAAFQKQTRALSHGCIRVKDIDRLAAELMSDAGGDPAQLEEALASRETTTLRLPRTWQVYLVYFTADVDEAGRLVTYGDPYGRDAELVARLDGAGGIGGGMQVAAR